MTTIYFSHTVDERLDDAQDQINDHLGTGVDGRCLNCGEVEPCPSRVAASLAFARYGRLPRRQPGLTRMRSDPATRGDRTFKWLTPGVSPGALTPPAWALAERAELPVVHAVQ